ncbi:MAG TPA: hypothetical protein VF756_21900 [Thermoanaerobaculia bacterium]
MDYELDAWTLFRDREALEKKLTLQVRMNVHANTDIMIPGEAAVTVAEPPEGPRQP